jgi:hypothetical protein
LRASFTNYANPIVFSVFFCRVILMTNEVGKGYTKKGRTCYVRPWRGEGDLVY